MVHVVAQTHTVMMPHLLQDIASVSRWVQNPLCQVLRQLKVLLEALQHSLQSSAVQEGQLLEVVSLCCHVIVPVLQLVQLLRARTLLVSILKCAQGTACHWNTWSLPKR